MCIKKIPCVGLAAQGECRCLGRLLKLSVGIVHRSFILRDSSRLYIRNISITKRNCKYRVKHVSVFDCLGRVQSIELAHARIVVVLKNTNASKWCNCCESQLYELDCNLNSMLQLSSYRVLHSTDVGLSTCEAK
jgi:hypothetical protein